MQWLRTNFFFAKLKVGSSNVYSLQNFIHFLSQVAQGGKKKKTSSSAKKKLRRNEIEITLSPRDLWLHFKEGSIHGKILL